MLGVAGLACGLARRVQTGVGAGLAVTLSAGGCDLLGASLGRMSGMAADTGAAAGRGWMLGRDIVVASPTALDGRATRIVRGVAARAVAVLGHPALADGDARAVTRLTGHRLSRCLIDALFVAGLAPVVAAKDRANQLVLVTALAAGDRDQCLLMGQVTLAAALDLGELRFAVVEAVAFVATGAVRDGQRWLAVGFVAVRAIDPGVDRDGLGFILFVGVAGLAVRGNGSLASGEIVALAALDAIAVNCHDRILVTALAQRGRRRLESIGGDLVTVGARKRCGTRQVGSVQRVVESVGALPGGLLGDGQFGGRRPRVTADATAERHH